MPNNSLKHWAITSIFDPGRSPPPTTRGPWQDLRLTPGKNAGDLRPAGQTKGWGAWPAGMRESEPCPARFCRAA